jgi:hypothetical protein
VPSCMELRSISTIDTAMYAISRMRASSISGDEHSNVCQHGQLLPFGFVLRPEALMFGESTQHKLFCLVTPKGHFNIRNGMKKIQLLCRSSEFRIADWFLEIITDEDSLRYVRESLMFCKAKRYSVH